MADWPVISLLVLPVVAWLAWHHWPAALAGLVLLIPTYLLRFSIVAVPTNLFEVSLVTVFLIGAAQTERRRSWWLAITSLPRPLLWFGLAWLTATFVSTAISAERIVSLGIIKGWVIAPLLLGWLIYAQQRAGPAKSKSPTLIIKALVLSGTAISLLALAQLGRLPRLTGIYAVPNSLAWWVAPLLVLTLWLGRNPKHRRLAMLLALPQIFALLATQSLAALAAVLAALGYGAIRWLKNPRQTLCLLLLGLITAVLILLATGRVSYFIEPLTNSAAHSSASVRWQLWDVATELIAKRPLLGLGLGQFEPHYQQALHQRVAAGENIIPEFVFRDPHNWLVSFWLNTGLLGLVSFASINAYLLWRVSHISRPSVPTQALTLALITLLLFGLFDTLYWKNDSAVLYWTILALLTATLPATKMTKRLS